MAIDYSQFKFGKGQPRAVARLRTRQQAEQDLKEAYKIVDARDGPKCRVTGTRTEPGHVDPRRRREHHHLEKRSTHKDRRADPSNIIVTCATVHMLLEQGLIEVEGSDASTPNGIRFHWAPSVKAEDKVIRIQSRRRSQVA